MYHTAKSKYISLGAILGGGFAPKWLPLPLFTELLRAKASRKSQQRGAQTGVLIVSTESYMQYERVQHSDLSQNVVETLVSRHGKRVAGRRADGGRRRCPAVLQGVEPARPGFDRRHL